MRNKFILPLALLIFGFFGCNAQNSSSDSNSATRTEISVDELKKLIDSKDSNLVILDVRTAEELTGELGAIPGIIHIPVLDLDRRAGELDKYKDKEIKIICRSGNRSGKACTLLNEKGFKTVNVAGGMKAFRKIEPKE
ncbi:MAG: rhodanese-like domain-containing protein [Bacteroidetes bacterium]|nr:rhodanese-like domain-containing protein [Bacteroidota bacterium]